MYHWKLNTLIAECKNARIKTDYRTIRSATGVSTGTLTGMAKQKTQRVDAIVIHKLLDYFSATLKRKVEYDELVEWRDKKVDD